ncbi:MAG: sulfotransferase [Thermoplasmatota archaeon]
MAVLVHAGYHKTGSTWLQTRFFPRHPHLMLPWRTADVERVLVHVHPLRFDAEAARAALRPGLEAATAEGLVPVVSAERLSGSPLFGGFDAPETLARIKEVFPEATLWLSLRNQVDAIASYYREYVTGGGQARLPEFLRGLVRSEHDSVLLQHYDYVPLLRHARGLFGDRLLVTLFERFQQDPAAEMRKVCDRLDVPLHPEDFDFRPVRGGLRDGGVRFLRPLNAFFEEPGTLAHGAFRLPGRKAVVKMAARRNGRPWLRSAVAEHVGGRYDEPNRALAAFLGEDPDALRGLGWRVA